MDDARDARTCALIAAQCREFKLHFPTTVRPRRSVSAASLLGIAEPVDAGAELSREDGLSTVVANFHDLGFRHNAQRNRGRIGGGLSNEEGHGQATDSQRPTDGGEQSQHSMLC